MGNQPQQEWIFGYKVHLVCDTESELPLAFEVTSADVHDSKMLPIMMEKIAKMGFKPKYVLADAGYDSIKNRR
ncbi:MAG: transposase [Candidatus Bathyarchaeia archaeon]